MDLRLGRTNGPSVCLLFVLLFAGLTDSLVSAAESSSASSSSVAVKPTSGSPIEITADHIQYLQNLEVYEAEGHVVVAQAQLRLTADRVTLMTLSGTMIAEGHVHLTDPTSDTEAERLEIDVNTQAGVLTNGTVFLKQSDTLITGRLLQRFSESHYRAKDGSFTNCDAKDGQVPAWRFTFKDLDLNVGEGIYARSVRVCINDVPVIPLPSILYPIQTTRKTGFLIPQIGYDNRFGFTYRQSFFWALTPSQDAIISPNFMSNRGQGVDLEYRYAMNSTTSGVLNRGQWLTSFIQDTQVNKSRALISGLHRQQVNPDLTVNAQAFLLTDPNILNDLSNSGVQRALPSGDSNLYVSQRLDVGNVYFLGQYLQPLQAGGKDTFQRLPEIGTNIMNLAPFDGPILLGLESGLTNFYRDVGFQQNRADIVPSISTRMLDIGHVVGLTPQVRFREVYYSHNVMDTSTTHRETFWAALEGSSKLSRQFRYGDGGSVQHTIEPKIIYEFVPATHQGDIVQIDAVDELPKKNLITYSLYNRLLEQQSRGTTSWLDVVLAQSYHVGETPNRTRDFFFTGTPFFGSLTQPLQPPTVPVHTNKFSDLWARTVIGNPVGAIRMVDHVLTVDAFYDPYRNMFSQFNTDLRFQYQREWYVEVGQRHTRDGVRPRRGDIWNPISFNEVFAPTQELNFLTLAGGFRGPFGLAFGGRTYYNLQGGGSPETDVVALYRNPCECWSLGLYYIHFPDRVQYNFMLTLTGIGTTENFGTQIMKYLLQPLLIGERALPWPSPYGKRSTTTAMPSPGMLP
ncbi:MAG: LPS assembly protein LptD [Nitrospirota bacterium]|nr:LPS assembly protein LptD [Nitrospirota bacterium]